MQSSDIICQSEFPPVRGRLLSTFLRLGAFGSVHSNTKDPKEERANRDFAHLGPRELKRLVRELLYSPELTQSLYALRIRTGGATHKCYYTTIQEPWFHDNH